ncbi:MAG: hypothetical protein ACYSUK_09685, partial [Planctomycetota bacterium]
MTADKNTNKLIEKLIKNWNLELSTNKEADDAVHKDVLTAHRETIQTQPTAIQPNIWRIIMKSKITKLAAAASIIIVTGIVLSILGTGTPTFAQVIEPILNARTVAFD